MNGIHGRQAGAAAYYLQQNEAGPAGNPIHVQEARRAVEEEVPPVQMGNLEQEQPAYAPVAGALRRQLYRQLMDIYNMTAGLDDGVRGEFRAWRQDFWNALNGVPNRDPQLRVPPRDEREVLPEQIAALEGLFQRLRDMVPDLFDNPVAQHMLGWLRQRDPEFVERFAPARPAVPPNPLPLNPREPIVPPQAVRQDAAAGGNAVDERRAEGVGEGNAEEERQDEAVGGAERVNHAVGHEPQDLVHRRLMVVRHGQYGERMARIHRLRVPVARRAGDDVLERMRARAQQLDAHVDQVGEEQRRDFEGLHEEANRVNDAVLDAQERQNANAELNRRARDQARDQMRDLLAVLRQGQEHGVANRGRINAAGERNQAAHLQIHQEMQQLQADIDRMTREIEELRDENNDVRGGVAEMNRHVPILDQRIKQVEAAAEEIKNRSPSPGIGIWGFIGIAIVGSFIGTFALNAIPGVKGIVFFTSTGKSASAKFLIEVGKVAH